MSDTYLNKVVVDVQSRTFQIWSDEGTCKTIDCSDDYEAFLRVLEKCREMAPEETIYTS